MSYDWGDRWDVINFFKFLGGILNTTSKSFMFKILELNGESTKYHPAEEPQCLRLEL
jgi:hypothetical protein